MRSVNSVLDRLRRGVAITIAGIFCSGGVYLGIIAPTQPARVSVALADPPIKTDQGTLDNLVRTPHEIAVEVCPKYGVPEIFVETLLKKESGGRSDAIRFERSQLDRARRITKDPTEQMMYASSIGAFQVMGWWAPEFGLKWHELVDVRTNAEVACHIMARCLDNTPKGTKRADRFWRAAKCYNGDGPKAEAYANDFLRIMSNKALESLPLS